MTSVTSNFDLTPFIAGLARAVDVDRLATEAGGAVVTLVQEKLLVCRRSANTKFLPLHKGITAPRPSNGHYTTG